jgi:hypothetical protein
MPIAALRPGYSPTFPVTADDGTSVIAELDSMAKFADDPSTTANWFVVVVDVIVTVKVGVIVAETVVVAVGVVVLVMVLVAELTVTEVEVLVTVAVAAAVGDVVLLVQPAIPAATIPNAINIMKIFDSNFLTFISVTSTNFSFC